MAISSRRNSMLWVPMESITDVNIGDYVRVKYYGDIEPLIDYDRAYHYGPKLTLGQNFITFSSYMERFCGKTYKVINKEGEDLIQLDTNKKNGNGEGFWFHYVFLEYAS